MTASGDYMQMALTTSNKMTGLGLDDPAVVALRETHAALFGAAANNVIFSQPDITDYTELPGGGVLVPGYPVFLACDSVALGAVQTVSIRIHYTVIELKTDEYLELIESSRMLS